MNARIKEQLPPSRPKVNQIQRRYLQGRLEQAARDKRDVDTERMPAELKALEKRIGAWHTAQHTKADKIRTKVREARKLADQVILFGTPEEALAAVEKFEKLTV